jgi:hypothetical protein
MAAALIFFSFLAVNEKASLLRQGLLWGACVGFLIAILWIRQRFAGFLVPLGIFSFAIWRAFKFKKWIPVVRATGLLGAVAIVFALTASPWTFVYWKGFISPWPEKNSLTIRKKMLWEGMAEQLETSQKSPETSQKSPPHPQGAGLFGKGLGSYSFKDPYHQYPHNILVETFYELGPLGLLVILCLTLYGLFLASCLLLRANDPWVVSSAFILLTFVGHAMKAGDLGGLGFYFFVIAWIRGVWHGAPFQRDGSSG